MGHSLFEKLPAEALLERRRRVSQLAEHYARIGLAKCRPETFYRRAVIVNGTKYDSIQHAYEATGYTPESLKYAAINGRPNRVHGFTAKWATPRPEEIERHKKG